MPASSATKFHGTDCKPASIAPSSSALWRGGTPPVSVTL